MKRSLLVLCLVAFLAATTLAADVSGRWNVDGDVYGNPVTFSCVLKQEGGKLTGTATLEAGRETPVTGTVEESAVTFEYDSEHQGTTYHLVFTGTLSDDGAAMKGSIAVAGVEGVFTAKKQ